MARSSGGADLRLRRKMNVGWITGLAPLVVLLAIWELVGDSDSLIYPVPSEWWVSVKSMWSEGLLSDALLRTLSTFVASLILVILLGVLLGLAIGSSPLVERAMRPIIDFTRSIPPPVLIPLAALLFGFNWIVGVGTVVFSTIWFILLNIVSAVRQIPPTRRQVGTVLGLPRVRAWLTVLPPSVVPAVLISLRQVTTVAFVVTLVADIFGSGDGLGRLIVIRQQSFDSPAVWGLLVIIGIFGYLLNLIVNAIDRTFAWRWNETR